MARTRTPGRRRSTKTARPPAPSASPDAALEQAAQAAECGDWTACLTALLAVWRAVPDPALAELIERVSPKSAGPPIDGSGSLSKNVAKRLASATEVDVPPILELALREMRTIPGSYHWAIRLAEKQPRDPRIATALVEIAKFSPWADMRRNKEGALLPEVTRALDAIDDPRYRQFLTDESSRHEERRRYIRKHKPGLDKLLAIATAIAQRPPPASLEVAPIAARIDRALVHRAPAQRKRSDDTADLLAAIYANPADTSLRMIYADALQEAGDPRGQLIAQQCARGDRDPPARDERELLKTHGRAWLGEIEPIINKQGVVFRRGFVACAREGLKSTKHYPLLTSPIWSTMEELDLSISGEHAVAFLRDPRWRVLRRVFGVDCTETISGLAEAGATRPWITLGIRYPDAATTPDAIAAIAPDLVELDLSCDVARASSFLRQLALHPLGKRVKRYRVATRYEQAPAILAAAPPGAEIELVGGYSFPGDPEGSAVRVAGGHVTLVFHDHKIDASYATTKVLDQLHTIESIAIEAPPGARVDEPSWAVLLTLLQRHGLTVARPEQVRRAR